MTTPTADQFTALPRWAQRYIQDLRLRATQAESAIQALRGEHKDTNVSFSLGFVNYPLPARSHVQFRLWGDNQDMVIEAAKDNNGRLTISTHGYRLIVYPCAANRITVEPEPYKGA